MKKYIYSLSLLTLLATSAIAQEHHFDPPWNTAPQAAVNFTVPGINNVPDLYGDIVDPQLVVFFAGNQFMCIDEILDGFKKKHPEYKRIFVETLPPGILAQQIEGGSLTLGNLKITHLPDVYAAGKERILGMQDYFSRTETYAFNKLTLMVPKGNPKQIRGISDLSQAKLRIAMPNPAWEGVGRHIETVYRRVGGERLHQQIMEQKVQDQSTYLTKIHHRESPMRVLYGQADVAPVWYSEVIYQQAIQHPIDMVEIPDDQNIKATYMIAQLKTAPRAQAAADFINYMLSEEVRQVYLKYGFQVD